MCVQSYKQENWLAEQAPFFLANSTSISSNQCAVSLEWGKKSFSLVSSSSYKRERVLSFFLSLPHKNIERNWIGSKKEREKKQKWLQFLTCSLFLLMLLLPTALVHYYFEIHVHINKKNFCTPNQKNMYVMRSFRGKNSRVMSSDTFFYNMCSFWLLKILSSCSCHQNVFRARYLLLRSKRICRIKLLVHVRCIHRSPRKIKCFIQNEKKNQSF